LPLRDVRQYVFLDESGVTTDLLRRYGRSPRGHRLRDHTPCGHWQTHTVVAALRLEGLSATAVFDGPIDNPSFLAYVEQILVPTLRPGDVVVLDNLATNNPRSVPRLSASARVSAFCRLTVRTSIRLSLRLPNSKPSCARRDRAASITSVRSSRRRSGSTPAPSAPITSATAAIASLRRYEKRSNLMGRSSSRCACCLANQHVSVRSS
jgi:DDE superfamily endonuclease